MPGRNLVISRTQLDLPSVLFVRRRTLDITLRGPVHDDLLDGLVLVIFPPPVGVEVFFQPVVAILGAAIDLVDVHHVEGRSSQPRLEHPGKPIPRFLAMTRAAQVPGDVLEFEHLLEDRQEPKRVSRLEVPAGVVGPRVELGELLVLDVRQKPLLLLDQKVLDGVRVVLPVPRRKDVGDRLLLLPPPQKAPLRRNFLTRRRHDVINRT
mmetsp:Transcript_18231/g.58802  ORF Transcript_18231/g.58802 Transcript_18231/m.58802 type:complete len:208 (+) Transcript_18231:759-1382(+)